MLIISEDNKRMVNIGTSDIWHSVYSTVKVRLEKFEERIPMAIDFFENGLCQSEQAIETARQFNHIRDYLSQYGPEKAVYDCCDLSIEAPWKNRLSSVITSCANLYITADGKDLLYEVVCVLCYASVVGVNVKVM